jgi:hypothetical protein
MHKLPDGATVILFPKAAMAISNGHASVAEVKFEDICPYPSAPAVDPRYAEAVRKQKEQNGRTRPTN